MFEHYILNTCYKYFKYTLNFFQTYCTFFQYTRNIFLICLEQIFKIHDEHFIQCTFIFFFWILVLHFFYTHENILLIDVEHFFIHYSFFQNILHLIFWTKFFKYKDFLNGVKIFLNLNKQMFYTPWTFFWIPQTSF